MKEELIKPLDYNTQRVKLHMFEYGRNIQKMVEDCVKIEDRTERQKLAEYIVRIMVKKNYKQLEIPEYLEKLWLHMFIMSDYKLDVDIPSNISIDKHGFSVKPEKISYVKKQRDLYRHYGINIKKMIKKFLDLKEGEEKNNVEKNLISNMKKKYYGWNNANIHEEEVLKDIEKISVSGDI